MVTKTLKCWFCKHIINNNMHSKLFRTTKGGNIFLYSFARVTPTSKHSLILVHVLSPNTIISTEASLCFEAYMYAHKCPENFNHTRKIYRDVVKNKFIRLKVLL